MSSDPDNRQYRCLQTAILFGKKSGLVAQWYIIHAITIAIRPLCWIIWPHIRTLFNAPVDSTNWMVTGAITIAIEDVAVTVGGSKSQGRNLQ